MSTTVVIIVLIVGVILFMQARKRGDTKQGRTLRMVALALMIVALVLAILNALDIVQDLDANEPAPRGIDVSELDNA